MDDLVLRLLFIPTASSSKFRKAVGSTTVIRGCERSTPALSASCCLEASYLFDVKEASYFGDRLASPVAVQTEYVGN